MPPLHGEDNEVTYADPPLPAADQAYGCRWLWDRFTRVHAARGLSYYRDAFDRLTEFQVMI